MDLPPELALVHQPHRLRLMGLLYRHRDISYTRARDLLGLSDGNLATHARRLEEAGLLHARRALAGDRFEVRYRITPEGVERFRAYLRALQEFLAEQQSGGGP